MRFTYVQLLYLSLFVCVAIICYFVRWLIYLWHQYFHWFVTKSFLHANDGCLQRWQANRILTILHDQIWNATASRWYSSAPQISSRTFVYRHGHDRQSFKSANISKRYAFTDIFYFDKRWELSLDCTIKAVPKLRELVRRADPHPPCKYEHAWN